MTEDDFDAVLDLGKGLISSEELQSWGRGGALEFSFIADVDSHMVGFNLAYVEFFGIPISKLCVISGIVVEEEYHRLGIGYRLVEGVFKACKEQNVDLVRALVVDGDARLLNFTERMGFKRSTVINYDRSMHDDI